jgi:hypothetical protein
VLAIHDYIVLNGSYVSNADNLEKKAILSKTEGLLMYGEGVCSSYSGSIYLLTGMAGMDSVFVTGIGHNRNGSSEAHTWNKIKIDGLWYNFDVTWNDPATGKPGEISYAYFALTDEEMSADHTWNRSTFPQSAFSDDYNYYNYNNKTAQNSEQLQSILAKELSQKKDKPEITLRLYVKNYVPSKKDLAFVYDIVPPTSKVMYSQLRSSSGEFTIKITQ